MSNEYQQVDMPPVQPPTWQPPQGPGSQDPASQGQLPQGSMYQGQPPQKTKRSTPMFVSGIVLMVLSGIVILGQTAYRLSGNAVTAKNGAEVLGGLVGVLLFFGVPFALGIVLIVKSKRKVG